MTEPYLLRLAERSAALRTVLCLGIDPDPSALPPGLTADARGIEEFARLLVDAAAPHAAAVKINIAFFEAFGSAGIAALERVRAAIPPEIPVILDAKRGDIGSTAGRQASALFDALGADAITVNPYLGGEAIQPLVGRPNGFAYVLCRTSNPGAGEFQDLEVTVDGDGSSREHLYLRVASRARLWASPERIGLVVGATAPAELESVRRVAPDLAFLVPGVGAQGGDADAVLAHGAAGEGDVATRPGGGLLVNVSRGIAGAALETGREPLEDRLAASAREWAARLPVLG